MGFDGRHKSGHQGHHFRNLGKTGHHRKQEKNLENVVFSRLCGGDGGIRTHESLQDYLISSAVQESEFREFY